MPEPPAPAETASALLALWNGVEPALEADYNDWHAREHVPERLTVPGILWGWRYRLIDAATGAGAVPGYLTLYGLRSAAVLDSAPYQRLLREPTPASRRMRPALTQLSRWVCRLVEPGALEAATALDVWTLAEAPGAAAHAAGRLLGQRLKNASPLPWLQAGQAGPAEAITGDWLLCAAPAEGARQRSQRLPAGGHRYHRLPAG